MTDVKRLAAAVLMSSALGAGAVPLNPGASFVLDDALGDGTAGVTLLDRPEFGLAPVATVNSSANRTEDGFDGFDVVTGLYDVTAFVDQEILLGPDGVIFKLTFDGDVGFSPGPNGYLDLILRGFGDWDLDIEYIAGTNPFPYLVSRSLDGDEISFGNEFDLLFGNAGTVFVSTNAPTYDFSGSGEVEILVDTFGAEFVALSPDLGAPAAVPVPDSALLLIGALGMGLGLRRRR